MTVPPLQKLLGWLDAALQLRGVKRRVWNGDGWTLSYHVGGPAESETVVVLVHGMGSSSLSWVKVLPALRRRYRVYAPDLPGWGYSPLPPGRDHVTMPQLTDAVVAFLETVVQRRVLLVGQSLGGWVAAKVAARRPDLVHQLVLCNSAGVFYPEVRSLRDLLDVRSQTQVESFWHQMWHKVPWFYRYFTDDYVAKMHEPRVLQFFDALQEGDFLNDDLARIQVPTSILWGTSDRFIPIETVDTMVRSLSDARVYWIPRCGHIPALERPKEFLRILRAIAPAPPAQKIRGTTAAD